MIEKDSLRLERGCMDKNTYHASMKTKFPPFGSRAFTKLGVACLCHHPCEKQRQENHSGVPASSRAPGSVRHPVSKEQGGE